MAQKQIIIICGEPSGDLNAASLAEALLKINPDLKISGVGGKLLRSAGAETFYDIKELSVLGVFDALRKLPLFLRLKKIILRKIEETRPAMIILVDFSGFNLRLARALDKKIPVIYYTSPQVWASRPGRIETIKKYVSRMIVLFEFEKEFYKKYGVNTEWFGHPLLDKVKPSMAIEDFSREYNLSGEKAVVALLPGSRKAEVKNILPVMLETAKIMSKGLPRSSLAGASKPDYPAKPDNDNRSFQFLIAKSAQVNEDIYKNIIRPFSNLDIKIIKNRQYDCISSACFCLVASGTATLETAILGKPFAVLYKMGLLSYLLYLPQVRLPYISLVNILSGKKVVPEFIQFNAMPGRIAKEALRLMKDSDASAGITKELRRITLSLGPPGAAQRAAAALSETL